MTRKEILLKLKEFLKDIHNEYVNARKVVRSKKIKRIIRGHSHTISSIAEDLFAKLLFKCINKKVL